MIEAYIFDMDGTLVDTEILWVDATELFLREQGLDATRRETERIVYGWPWADVYAGLAKRFPELSMPRAGMDRALHDCFERCRNGRDLCIPGSVSLLRRLARQYPVSIVSGATRAEVRKHVDLLGIESLLQFSLASEDYAPGKPDPQCYRLAAERLGVPPEACAAFEDSTVGLRAARGAGMRCVALRRHPELEQDFSGADLVLPSLENFAPELLGR